MPMIVVDLPCGCRSVAHYQRKCGWLALSKDERAEILAATTKGHQCPKPVPKPPAVSPETQRP
jgi:hypothetical protein